jgi:hypothetical protein
MLPHFARSPLPFLRSPMSRPGPTPANRFYFFMDFLMTCANTLPHRLFSSPTGCNEFSGLGASFHT